MKRPKVFKPLHQKFLKGREHDGREAIDRLYNYQWEKYRAVFLNVNPVCYACGKSATVVDHLNPHKGDFNLFWKIDNYLPLCKKDHDTITNLFDRRHQPGTPPTKKIQWLAGMRSMMDLSHRVKIVPFGSDLEEWIRLEKEKGP